jgi:rubrerythrin
MESGSTTPPVGASYWERELYKYLVEHTSREGAMLAEYVTAAEETDSKALAYLINLLVEDEHRHHRFFNELASSLKTEAELSGADPTIPRLDLNKADQENLIEVTSRLLEHERDDAKELKRLRKDLHDLEDTTLWAVLVEVMMRDTDKHIAILEFVMDHSGSKRSRIHLKG